MPRRRITIATAPIPFRSAFRHASATRRVAENVIVRIEDDDGLVGLGEGCPRAYVTGETAATALEFLHRRAPRARHGNRLRRGARIVDRQRRRDRRQSERRLRHRARASRPPRAPGRATGRARARARPARRQPACLRGLRRHPGSGLRNAGTHLRLARPPRREAQAVRRPASRPLARAPARLARPAPPRRQQPLARRRAPQFPTSPHSRLTRGRSRSRSRSATSPR